MTQQKQTKPKRDPEFMRQIARKGGEANAKSPNRVVPFRDIPGLAKKAGSVRGYTFKRKSS